MKFFRKSRLSLAILITFIVAPIVAYALSSVTIKSNDNDSTSAEVVGRQLRSSTQDYAISVAEGLIDGHELFSFSAHSPVINTALQVMWGVAPATQTEYVFNSAAQLTVVSDDVDDYATGAGAQEVTITGVIAGYVATTEVLALDDDDGTEAVTTVNTWLRVNSIEITAAGASGANEGDITILSGTDIYAFMEAGTNLSNTGIYTVPAGYTATITDIAGSAAGTKNVHISVMVRLFGGLFREVLHRTVNDAPFSMSMLVLPEKTDILVNVQSDVNGGAADITMIGVIEED